MSLLFLRAGKWKDQNRFQVFRRRGSISVSEADLFFVHIVIRNMENIVYTRVLFSLFCPLRCIFSCRCDEHSESDYVELSNYMAHDINYSRYCGNLTTFSVTSTRNFFRVSFRSNHILDGPGFRATYRFANESLPTKNISNPNFAHVQSKYRATNPFVWRESLRRLKFIVVGRACCF